MGGGLASSHKSQCHSWEGGGGGRDGGVAACCYMPRRKCVRKFPLSRSPSAASVSVSSSCPCVVFLARRRREEAAGARTVNAFSQNPLKSGT